MSFNTILFDEVDNVVEVQYQGVNAAILAEHEVRITTLETSTAADFAALQAELNAFEVQLNTLTLLVQQNYDTIHQEIEDRENENESQNEAFENELILTQQMAADAIAAEADIRAAAIINEANTRGTAIAELETQVNTDISAIATTVDALASQVAGNTANIVLANEAIVTETVARTAQYEALQVDFGDTNAAVLEESVARADGDDALASQITVLEADVDGAYAAVMTEQTARIAGDSALSSDITTLSAQVGTNTTAISTETSARIAADGSIESKYAVKIDVNGRVAGFGLISTANNATPTSIFAVTADSFKVYNGTTDVAPFSVSGGIVRMQNVVIDNAVIENAAITSLKIANGAVTNTAVNSPDPGGLIPPASFNSWLSSFALSITTTAGSKVLIWAQHKVSCPGSTGGLVSSVRLRLRRNATLVGVEQESFALATGTAVPVTTYTLIAVDEPPAGTHNYYVETYFNTNNVVTDAFIQPLSVIVTEIKK